MKPLQRTAFMYRIRRYLGSLIDNVVYKLFRWRWNKILANCPATRELFISYLKSYDTLDEGEQITVTIEKTKTTKVFSNKRAT